MTSLKHTISLKHKIFSKKKGILKGYSIHKVHASPRYITSLSGRSVNKIPEVSGVYKSITGWGNAKEIPGEPKMRGCIDFAIVSI